MGERVAVAWLASLGRLYLAASSLAVVLLVRALPDFPLEVDGVVATLLTLAAPAFAAFGALWRAPSRWAFFVGPVVLGVAAFLLARAALDAPSAVAGLPPVSAAFVNARLVPLSFVMLPGLIVGTVLAAMSLDR